MIDRELSIKKLTTDQKLTEEKINIVQNYKQEINQLNT